MACGGPWYPSGVSGEYERIDWYDLPRYYDIAFASLNTPELEFLEAMYDRYAPGNRRRVLEPACGSGRLVEGMVRRGYRVTGYDRSEAMVAYARARLKRLGLSATLTEDDMTRFSSRARFELAHCLVSTFKYLLSEDAARQHLQSVANVLVPGGIYVLGLHLTDYRDRSSDEEVWSGKRGQTQVECRIQSQPPDRRSRTEALRARLTVTKPSKTLRMETEWDFRTYSGPQFKQLLRKVPELKHVATHNFEYDADCALRFDDVYLDQVCILQKQA